MEGQTATITCELSSPEQDVIWFKNGEEIKSTDRIQLIREGLSYHLIINETTLMDQAEYLVVNGDKHVTTRLIVEGKV